MKKYFIYCLFLLGWACVPAFVFAKEQITDFDVAIDIHEDASITITETIEYDFGKDTLNKHGIYRDIPTKYDARGGNYNLRVSNVTVTDTSGSSYTFLTSQEGNDLRIKIGEADITVTGQKTYIIQYTILRALNFYESSTELYWNVTGNAWEVPILKASAGITGPKSTSSHSVKIACFTGPYGSTETCSESTTENNIIHFSQTDLAPGDGLTLVVGLPAGIVHKPSPLQNILFILQDNWILGLPLLVLGIMYYLWNTQGKDPAGRKTIIARYSPPDDLTPVEVGTLVDEKAGNGDVSSMIIDLAIRGYIKITKLEKKLLRKQDYLLEKLKPFDSSLRSFETKLLSAFFSGSERVKISDLKNKLYKDLPKIQKDIYTTLISKQFFPKSPKKVRALYMGIGIGLFFLTTFSSSFLGGYGMLSIGISAAIIVAFSFIMPVKTKTGVLAKEHILGLKEYLSVAEKDRIKFHNAPEKNPAHFEKLLPFAMVLGVESQWAEQFKDMYTEDPSWFNDPSGGAFNSMLLANSMSDFSSVANSTLTSKPSNASGGGSGFSGGGSGGGFGGGGGGSW